MCRSRRELSNAYLLAKIGVDTAENEPLEVWGDNSIHYSLHSLFKIRGGAGGGGRERAAPEGGAPAASGRMAGRAARGSLARLCRAADQAEAQFFKIQKSDSGELL